ncbi:2,3-bisphosphoglycerate-independent phosphoglycerate mutase [Candidatus Micrarchaeota archaeon]|nr:2,3-bisphosphoglycerate-independent phosphoglycerate mutase [Candidatus Micrarchaeota archaeon]
MSFAKKTLFIVLDGLGDRPIQYFGGLTPLEVARTPNISALVEKGACGLLDVIGVGVRPGSDTGHISLLGYDPHAQYTGRGPLEAVGLGVHLADGELAFRANFATVNSQGVVVDRRAGRIDSAKPLEAALNSINVEGVKCHFKAGAQHRGVLIFRPQKGMLLSDKISNVDSNAQGVKISLCRPLDKSPEAAFTADAVNQYLSKASKLLLKHPLNKTRVKNKLMPATGIIVRGAGVAPHFEQFKEKFGLRAAAVSHTGVYTGVAGLMGFDILPLKNATGRGDTDLDEKARVAAGALSKYDFVFLHIKGTDVFGHDGDYVGKRNFIERIDTAFSKFSDLNDTLVVITADHSTPCEMKNHSADAVPLLMAGPGVRKDAIRKFGERDCGRGGLGRLKGADLMPEILNIMARTPMYGS